MATEFKQAVKPYLEKIDHELRKLPGAIEPSLLHDPIEYFFQMPGKRIRPLITLITAENYGKTLNNVLHAALAIEILHDFTLIHDDIMDEDQYRRGYQTVHQKWDISTAILAGDAMVSLAYSELLKCTSPHLIEMIRQFTDGMYIVCAGQALDKEFESREDVTLKEYLLMISQKTARLIALAFQLGYLSASNSVDFLGKLTELGTHIGLAFQIQDDLLDYIGDQNNLGKDVGSDWRQKKKSYIAIAYQELQKQDPNLKPLFEFSTFSEALNQLQQIGIIEKTKKVIHSYLESAREMAWKIELSHPLFFQLIEFLEERNY